MSIGLVKMAAVHPAIGPAQACTTISGGKVLAVLFNKLAKFSGEKSKQNRNHVGFKFNKP